MFTAADVQIFARQVYADFRRYDQAFRRITRRAHDHFIARDWAGAQADRERRLDLWELSVAESADALVARFGDSARDRSLLHRVKEFYGERIDRFGDAEFARTFFTSVTRRLLDTVGVDPLVEFVLDLEPPSRAEAAPPARVHVCWDDAGALYREVLEEVPLPCRWEDLERDVAFVRAEVDARAWRHYRHPRTLLRLELVTPLFFQSTRAFVFGRAEGDGWSAPLALELGHRPGGLAVEAVHMSPDELSVVLGFTRSYFCVDVEPVAVAVRFLRSLVPDKPLDEVYALLGRVRQAKTERYRALARYLEHSTDRFVPAPGTRGMVMIVFTLPGHHLVFKIIRDSFAPAKKVTRDQVVERYRLVARHDRVGRMIDTMAFRHLALPLDSFSPEVLEELSREAARTVTIEERRVVFDHLYMERRVRPLDLFLGESSVHRAREAVRDYGQAIREMAAINIFPGDMLLKNFGMTRHGRVIFYDFDEVTLLTDCNFRELPAARDDVFELSDQVWYSVADNDVFPQEFGAFLGLSPALRAVFMEHHAELLTPAFWRAVQATHRSSGQAARRERGDAPRSDHSG